MKLFTLADVGLVALMLATAVVGNIIYTKTMTPKWLYENAEFASPSPIVAHDTKRLTVKSIGGLKRLFTVPLPCLKLVPGELIFKVTISLQTPNGDSDLYLGIGNKDGISGLAQIIDNRPFTNVLGTINEATHYRTVAEATGSSKITQPFDEEVLFVYKPSEKYAAFYSGNEFVTGVLSDGPDMTKDLYLTVNGDEINEIYKIQYITVQIENI
jgi:hypothetical protein